MQDPQKRGYRGRRKKDARHIGYRACKKERRRWKNDRMEEMSPERSLGNGLSPSFGEPIGWLPPDFWGRRMSSRDVGGKSRNIGSFNNRGMTAIRVVLCEITGVRVY